MAHSTFAALNREKSPTRAKRTETMGGTKTSKGKESKYANELKLIAEFAKQLVSRRVAIGKTFVEFWSDALLDPVAPCRPVFAVCQLQLTVNTVLLYTDDVKMVCHQTSYRCIESEHAI